MRKNSSGGSLSRRILVYLLIILGVLIVIHLFLQYLNLIVFEEKKGFVFELSNRFDLNDEISVSTWFSTIILFCVGLAAFFTAYLSPKKALKRLWVFIGVVGVLLSIDEGGSIHEFVLQSVHNIFFLNTAPTAAKNGWWLVLPLILFALILLSVKVIKLLPKRTSLLFILGASILIIGAAFVDGLTTDVPINTYFYQAILVAIEELLEILGGLVILYTILDYLEINHGNQIKTLSRSLKTNNNKT